MLTIFSSMVIRESSLTGLKRILFQVMGKRNSRKIHVNNGINTLPHNPDFLTTLSKKAFENIVGNGENASN